MFIASVLLHLLHWDLSLLIFFKLVIAQYLQNGFEFKQKRCKILIPRLELSIMGLYVASLSTSWSPAALHPVDVQLSVFHYLPISPTHAPLWTCFRSQPAVASFPLQAGIWLLLRWCVLNSPLTLAVTSVVMYWLCDQHLLPGFLILNKPELRYKLRHPFRHQKVFQQKFSFCLICR